MSGFKRPSAKRKPSARGMEEPAWMEVDSAVRYMPADEPPGCVAGLAAICCGGGTAVWVEAQPARNSDSTPACNIRAGLNIIFLMETLYITHPECRLPEMGSWHPECPARPDAINDCLLASGLMGYLREREAVPARDEDILRVHGAGYLEYLRRKAPDDGYFPIDADTIMNPHTLSAAMAAAGAGIMAVDAVMNQE